MATDQAEDVHHIEIRLENINQLFNTIDASPFHQRDLDADAEEFIVSWAREFPIRDPLVLTVHVKAESPSHTSDTLVHEAVCNYFAYRADLTRLEFRRLMREARLSLIIGLLFLSICVLTATLLQRFGNPALTQIPHEGLIIAGWVAMWHPLQMYLYEWWPVRRRWKTFEKMGEMRVEVVRD